MSQIGFLFFSILILVVVAVIIHLERYISRRNHFAYIFGFFPNEWGGDKEKGQRVVEKVLTAHAKRFFAIANWQTHVLDYIKEHGGYGKDQEIIETVWKNTRDFLSDAEIYDLDINYTTLDIFVVSLKREVGKLKRKFWYAWEITKYFKYFVKKQIGDYR